MRQVTGMIPKKLQTFGQDHAEGNQHDPEKLQAFLIAREPEADRGVLSST